MASSVVLLADVTAKPLGWGVVVGSATMGALALIAGVRVWQGRPINPRNSLEKENKMAVLTVSLLPISVVFFCWALIGLVSEAGSGTKGVVAALVGVIEVILSLGSLVVFLIAATLFFFSRPKRFVPPHLRTRS